MLWCTWKSLSSQPSSLNCLSYQAQISSPPKAAIAANVKRAGKARISGASMAKMAANVNKVWQAQISGKQAQIDGAMLGMTQQQTITEPTTVFSVWDGDWALVEEYDGSGNLFESYIQGYHGLVKTLVSGIYYYQDELGSTSHIADSTGHLLENYRYDLYGKPTYWDASGNQLQASGYNVRDLFTGQRLVTEIGLYDDRNRFMSPDLGRFLQPDPIGFKGDVSNLYRYCGNDWANRSDPMGTTGGDDMQKQGLNDQNQTLLAKGDQYAAEKQLQMGYITYSKGWSKADAANYQKDFSKLYENDPAFRSQFAKLSADSIQHMVFPDRNTGSYEQGARAFGIANFETVSTFHHWLDSAAERLLSTVGGLGAPKPPKNFIPPTNPPQNPPSTLPKGFTLRESRPPSSIYKNGSWRIMNEGGQYVDPSTMRPPGNVSHAIFEAMTHVEFPDAP